MQNKILSIIFIVSLVITKTSIADDDTKNNASKDLDLTEWIWVDTTHKRIAVMNHSKPVKYFEGVAFGRGGVGYKRMRGDKVTPKGIYKVGWENNKSQFRHFFGLTYPSINDANQGVIQKRISIAEYRSIVAAHNENRIPPQDTALGGQVGIHGLGSRDIVRHRTINWTFGCIALTNQQIDALSNYLRIGIVVIVG